MIYILPVFILLIIIAGFIKGVPCFDSFVKGAQNGAMTIVRLVPALIGLIVAIGVFRASGARKLIVEFCRPFMEKIGADSDILPLVLIRPVSGSASLATLRDIIAECGAGFPCRACGMRHDGIDGNDFLHDGSIYGAYKNTPAAPAYCLPRWRLI